MTTQTNEPFTLAVTTDFCKKALRLMARMPEMLAAEHPLPEHSAQHLPQLEAEGPRARMDTGINAALAEIGALLKVSRAYVMLDEEDGRYLRNTHEWVDGTSGPAMFSWPLHEYEKDLPSLKLLMADKDFFMAHTRDVPPDLHRVLSMQAVSSVLLVPLLREGSWIGLTGFDSCGRERIWQEEETAVLRHFARLLVLYFERREYADARYALEAIRGTLREHFPERTTGRGISARNAEPLPEVPAGTLSLQDSERRLIVDALELHGGNKSRAAKHLGLTWASLDRRCRKLGIY